MRKKIVLRKHSNMDTLKRRARKLAIRSIKEKFAKKDMNNLSYADKVRLEKLVAKRKSAVDRLARKLIPKVRQIEQKRLAR
jgi:hypothetical protein